MLTGLRWIAPALILIAMQATAAEYYVSPTGSDSASGTSGDPTSLTKANDTAEAGDTVVLTDGTYTSRIRPAHSGREGHPITYRAANRQKAVLKTGTEGKLVNEGSVFLSERSHIVIDGLFIRGAKRFIVGVNVHHITITNCRMTDGFGWELCRFKKCGKNIVFAKNHITQGNDEVQTDLLSIQMGDGHLIEDNYFGDGSHTGLVLLGVQRSVVRNNRFHNRYWKCMEVFSTRKSPERLSMYNLIEKNRFEYSPASSIQYAGNRSIIRKNVFWRTRSGMDWANYRGRAHTPEAWHNHGNRFYHNVIARCGATSLNQKMIDENAAKSVKVFEGTPANGFAMTFATNLPKFGQYGDQVMKNNIFYRNECVARKEIPGTTQVIFTWDASPAPGRFLYNAFTPARAGDKTFFWLDAKYEQPAVPQAYSVTEFQKSFSKWAASNVEMDPLFVDPDTGDFRLKRGSPCIDAAGPLTHALVKGAKSRYLNVGDASFFCDGFGVVPPDIIRVGDARAKVVKVDYETNVLTLDKPITWEQRAPVQLDFAGRAPDMGAHESGAKH